MTSERLYKLGGSKGFLHDISNASEMSGYWWCFANDISGVFKHVVIIFKNIHSPSTPPLPLPPPLPPTCPHSPLPPLHTLLFPLPSFTSLSPFLLPLPYPHYTYFSPPYPPPPLALLWERIQNIDFLVIYTILVLSNFFFSISSSFNHPPTTISLWFNYYKSPLLAKLSSLIASSRGQPFNSDLRYGKSCRTRHRLNIRAPIGAGILLIRKLEKEQCLYYVRGFSWSASVYENRINFLTNLKYFHGFCDNSDLWRLEMIFYIFPLLEYPQLSCVQKSSQVSSHSRNITFIYTFLVLTNSYFWRVIEALHASLLPYGMICNSLFLLDMSDDWSRIISSREFIRIK